jgi:hypothetical protein
LRRQLRAPYAEQKEQVVRRGETLVILVAGGDKRTQDQDIAMAIKLARSLQENGHEKDKA